ncbi:MAG: aminodeoxychorismate synthase component I [Xanthomonadales bacterium]|nr:aminodeoxychorismate synthase component I [Xanthomonadales bacterium]
MILIRELACIPDLLALHAAEPARYPVLLESVASGGDSARYDLLFATTGEVLLRDGDGAILGPHAECGSFLAALAAWQREVALPVVTATQPFRGGFALLLGYELAAEVEPSLRLPPSRLAVPQAIAWRTPVAIVRDRILGRAWVAGEATHPDLIERACVDAAIERGPIPPQRRLAAIAEEAPSRYLDGVRRALDYIAAGDVFQVNLSRAWRAQRPHGLDAASIYAALRESNPAPFAGLVQWDDWALACSSPERLVSLHQGVLQTRPIAGTRPRFAGDDDAARMRELVGHPKERAEHIMLIDLERNDLGRVAVPGSVVVDELMTVESYAHVHHIVSNVRAELRAGLGPVDAIRAVFPGGTITGCPKVRCMEIIAELEGEGRGFYTGALGYLGSDGELDLNILIRSMTIAGDAIEFRAGAGIVADSDPHPELAETRAKARGLIRALVEEAQ